MPAAPSQSHPSPDERRAPSPWWGVRLRALLPLPVACLPAAAAAQIGDVLGALEGQLREVVRFGVWALFGFGAILLIVSGRRLYEGLSKSPWKQDKVRHGLVLLTCGVMAIALPFLVQWVADLLNAKPSVSWN